MTYKEKKKNINFLKIYKLIFLPPSPPFEERIAPLVSSPNARFLAIEVIESIN